MLKSKDSLNVVSFFTGAGGFDLGFKQAGYKTVLANDIWEPSARTFRKNNPDSEFILKDIRNITEQEITQRLKSKNIRKVNVVIGGPPCQCFTRLNNNNLRKDDERTQLFRDYIRMIRILKPDFVVMENVADLLVRQNIKGRHFRDLIAESFKRAGYTVDYKVFETERYGVPQRRRRVIFLASRLNNVGISFPEETCHVSTVREYLTRLEKCKDLKNHEIVDNGKWVKTRIKQIPQGGYYEDLPTRLKVKKVRNGKLQIVKRYGSYFRRLDNDEPAITITKNYIIHPTKDRYLTNREKATLHTFPPEYEFEGSKESVAQQIANAVPPKLAWHLAKHILELYQQARIFRKESSQPSRRNCPVTV